MYTYIYASASGASSCRTRKRSSPPWKPSATYKKYIDVSHIGVYIDVYIYIYIYPVRPR